MPAGYDIIMSLHAMCHHIGVGFIVVYLTYRHAKASTVIKQQMRSALLFLFFLFVAIDVTYSGTYST